MENMDFAETDIPPPSSYKLVEGGRVSEAEKEEARESVLAWAMESEVEQELPQRSCDNCAAAVYDDSLLCTSCSSVAPACIVTGASRSRDTWGRARALAALTHARACRLPRSAQRGGAVHGVQVQGHPRVLERVGVGDQDVPVVRVGADHDVLSRRSGGGWRAEWASE